MLRMSSRTRFQVIVDRVERPISSTLEGLLLVRKLARIITWKLNITKLREWFPRRESRVEANQQSLHTF
jgi:L-serine deaminase